MALISEAKETVHKEIDRNKIGSEALLAALIKHHGSKYEKTRNARHPATDQWNTLWQRGRQIARAAAS